MPFTQINPGIQIVIPNDNTKYLRGDGVWSTVTPTPDSDATVTFTDITTNDASTTKHGFAVKAVAPAANLLNVVGIVNGQTAYTCRALFDSTNPAALGTASPGTSTIAAHRDHVHTLPAIDATAAQTDITTRNASTSSHGLALKATAPASTFVNVLGIANGETVYKMVTLWDATVPAVLGTAATGSALFSARRDHVHGSTTTNGLGYATGAGGTVTQGSGSGKATALTLSKLCGTITLDGAALAAATTVSFTWTNTMLIATDVVIFNHISTGTLGAYNITCNCGSSTATVYVRNVHTASLSEAIVIRFAVIKAVAA
jgi:hypothetical protein